MSVTKWRCILIIYLYIPELVTTLFSINLNLLKLFTLLILNVKLTWSVDKTVQIHLQIRLFLISCSVGYTIILIVLLLVIYRVHIILLIKISLSVR